MKWVIRRCIFESNSSTTHATVIMTAEQHERWEKEKLYFYQTSGWYNPYKELPEDEQPKNGFLYTQEEVLDFFKKIGDEYDPKEWEDEYGDDGLEQFIYEYDDNFHGYDRWHDSEYLEMDENYFTTPGGETVVVECKYGSDY